MEYISTRGEAPVLGFADAMLAGLARDGGLYLPRYWPEFSAAELRAMRGLPYPDLAIRLLTPFLGGEIDATAFERIVRDAYATFRHQAVCPLAQLDANSFVLELFHGPTLAFKDVAMQMLARLMDHVLTERGQRATIAGATSGDTGGAAIEAFAGRERTDIFILFPHGRVSPVQQRQMTTSGAANVHTLAIEGDFDGCQAIVHRPVDVKDIDADFYVFSGHKLYGPTGIGILYGKAEKLAVLPPYQGGGEMIGYVTQDEITYADPPHRFEAGTPPILEAIGLGAAIDWISGLDRLAVAEHEHALYAHVRERLKGANWLRVIGDAPGKGAILSFTVDGAHAHDVAQILDRYGVAVRAGTHCAEPLMRRFGVTSSARASFALYNTLEEADAFVDALTKTQAFFA